MPSAEQISQTVRSYLEALSKGSAEDAAGLYADDATVEDPVGGEVHIGHHAILGFYGNLAGSTLEPELVTLRALGREAAFLWRLVVRNGDSGGVRIEIISVMTFDEDGKIASMKAYWSKDDITPL
jgi:steroid Delta-isomerase